MAREPEVKSDPRRALPSVDLLTRLALEQAPRAPAWALAEAAREVLARARERVAAEGAAPPGHASLAERVAAQAQLLSAPRPRRVVNATGIVLHTNLGRAPLAAGAAHAAAEAAARYGDLEIDLESGRRGHQRLGAVADKLARLSGAEAAFAVNNNAAAVLLALDTLARGREVIVSRGELVEIGGSFRVPEIMERAGVRLVEVGSTNRTHLSDYERAIGPDTALLLKVHRSNFELRGFVAEVSLPELVALGRERGIPVVEDLGSGALVRLPGLPEEVYAPARLRLGPDLLCFSGDKLLGGPQSGLLIGRARRIEALRRNPLARAVRLDKLTLAALDWTLEAYLEGRAEREIPVLRQLTTAPEQLERRARSLAALLEGSVGEASRVAAVPDLGRVGGGSLPGLELPSWVVEIQLAGGAERLAARLRAAPVPVLARVREQRVLLDVRTLLDGDEQAVLEGLAFALDAKPR
jgi:L-seryl-tRNA(Ser) seleniumtransferase